jgi:hypothetical protein
LTWVELVFAVVGFLVILLFVIIFLKSHVATIETRERFWLLKINLKKFNIFDSWKDHPEIETDLWMTRYFGYNPLRPGRYRTFTREYMNRGDKVVLWITGDTPGIYAQGEITDKPSIVGLDILVPIRYTVKLFDIPLTREHDPLKRLPLQDYLSVEQINLSMWSYIKESAENELLKKEGMATKEVHFEGESHSVWVEKNRKSALWTLLIGGVLFICGLTMNVLWVDMISGLEDYIILNILSIPLLLFGIIFLVTGYTKYDYIEQRS